MLEERKKRGRVTVRDDTDSDLTSEDEGEDETMPLWAPSPTRDSLNKSRADSALDPFGYRKSKHNQYNA